ncbi:MAG: hypothetical protein HY882_16065 [Deltaproteobacteria bacterium]|nr:hypothetical protein [Deltaproteobacteria bacterium]
MNISQGLLPFQLIADTSKVLITSVGGLPLVMETFRALGLPNSVQEHLPLLQAQVKYEEADYVESFLSLFAAGGDCLDDFQLLRQDAPLQKLGLKVPSPEAARFFLNAFHEEEALEGRVSHQAFIPEETDLLRGLAVVTDMLSWDGERLLRWHRERCGTAEQVIDVLKKESPQRPIFPLQLMPFNKFDYGLRIGFAMTGDEE